MWEDIILFMAVGFAAQLIDGALGMAYGVSATSVMLGFGVPPATASASVHAAEVFTTGLSGLSHWRFGNVDFRLLRRLAIPGMIGGAVGAFLLSNLPGEVVRPLVSAYLLLMGLLILWKAFRKAPIRTEPPKWVGPLGLFGGFLDAIGGGGWGPMVTSSLLGQGMAPRYVIGSVNLAEFFVTATITSTFIFTIGLDLWPIIVGLVIGGGIAAPFAALVTARVPDKPLMILVGVLISLLSIRGVLQAFS
ncbi:sulfite exporter TauE/SafE family protein [Azospirillum sp. SYSU D00513]|uniref:sulfite exporter TauE/SafE family protein n=1 Tax=Azospirillum sp. SYSU D00513 TaxID=2812561 RepID=UPI001A969FDE|nr:sulfite exporter TauE/SafE family protein [Azospirillum sp. SYSU D00513]